MVHPIPCLQSCMHFGSCNSTHVSAQRHTQLPVVCAQEGKQ
uniref:Uncharacterized protein n=1 Tax=Arundo donax TaxID=35708 RepID=A0A0A9A9K5_ARUDO